MIRDKLTVASTIVDVTTISLVDSEARAGQSVMDSAQLVMVKTEVAKTVKVVEGPVSLGAKEVVLTELAGLVIDPAAEDVVSETSLLNSTTLVDAIALLDSTTAVAVVETTPRALDVELWESVFVAVVDVSSPVSSGDVLMFLVVIVSAGERKEVVVCSSLETDVVVA